MSSAPSRLPARRRAAAPPRPLDPARPAGGARSGPPSRPLAPPGRGGPSRSPRPHLRLVTPAAGGGQPRSPSRAQLAAPAVTRERSTAAPALTGQARRAAVRRPKPAFVPAVALCGCVVFGLVLLNIYVAQGSFRLADVQNRVAEQDSAYRRLRFEVASAESPERIARMASELGLVAPERQQYIRGDWGPPAPRGSEAQLAAGTGDAAGTTARSGSRTLAVKAGALPRRSG